MPKWVQIGPTGSKWAQLGPNGFKWVQKKNVRYSVILFHFRSFVTIVLSSLILLATSMFSLFLIILIWNCLFLEKLKIIFFVFFWINIILFLSTHLWESNFLEILKVSFLCNYWELGCQRVNENRNDINLFQLWVDLWFLR